MKKEYIIGGLALLGVIGVISYLNKPKRNSEGFFGATGGRTVGSIGASTGRSSISSGWCGKKLSDGSYQYSFVGQGGRCLSGFTPVRFFGDRQF